jgi:serine/threonine protein kinase
VSPKLEELLLRWEDGRQNGHPVSVDTLCSDCPDLRKDLLAQIAALEKMDQVLDLADGGKPIVMNERRPTRFDNLRSGWEPINGYRLEKRLGKGGFGEVWKANRPGKSPVALKFVSLIGQLGASERRSVDLIRTLRHPNVLTVFGAWQVHGFLVIAMEMADRTLLDRLNEAIEKGETGIPHDELIKYIEEAAKGIDYLNLPDADSSDSAKEAIQHRDIKPQNIFLVGDSLKIGDFGLLRILKKTVTEHTGSLTVSYAAPEFFMGHTSRSSDQYSLAVTYCHLLGGRLPFVGQPGQIMQGHLQGTPDLTMLPEIERPIVMRALAKKPEDRWPTCTAFVMALCECQTPKATRRRAKGWRYPLFLAAGALLLLPLLAVFLFSDLFRLVDEPVKRPELTKPDPANKTLPETEPKIAQPSEAEVLLQQGREFIQKNERQSAFDALSRAIEKDPKLAWAYAERAAVEWSFRQNAKCIADCDEAIRHAAAGDKGLLWLAYSTKGHAHQNESGVGEKLDDANLKKAIEAYSSAIGVFPENGYGYMWRGNSFRSMRDLDRSIADYSEAIRLAPPAWKDLLFEAYAYRGHCFREKGKAFAAEAIRDYSEALKLRPGTGSIYQNRAVAYRLNGDQKNAVKDESQAKKLGPKGK